MIDLQGCPALVTPLQCTGSPPANENKGNKMMSKAMNLFKGLYLRINKKEQHEQ